MRDRALAGAIEPGRILVVDGQAALAGEEPTTSDLAAQRGASASARSVGPFHAAWRTAREPRRR
jgi:hypothetical protein